MDAILKLSRDLHGERDLGTILDLILSTAKRLIGADRCSCFVRDEKTGELLTRVAQGTKTIRLRKGGGIAGAVAESGETVNLANAYDDPRFDPEHDLKSGYHTLSMLCLPMISRGDRIVGVLQALNKNGGQAFDDYDEQIMFTLCRQAAVAVDTAQLLERDAERQRLQADMDLARDIQQSLLPSVEPHLPGWRFSSWQRSCDETGGDYYDFLPVVDAVDMLVGDVAGHGIGAALYMSTARAFIRALQPLLSPPRLWQEVNSLLEADMADDSFMTAALCRLHLDGTASCVLAGHEPPLVYRLAEDRFDRIEGGGLLLGALPECTYETVPIAPLAPGDLLLLFTDGIFEVSNAEHQEWGLARLRETVRRHASEGIGKVIAEVVAAASAWLGEGAVVDDWTIVGAERSR